MGLLRVKGTLDLNQFWPDGESDADTTKVIVQTDQNAFEFQPHPSATFAVTHAFNNATVKGKAKKPTIDKKGRITVRLQGIDAPELHYRPSPVPRNKILTATQRNTFKQLNKEYRQYFGETCTVQLHELLKQAGSGKIECKVITAVDKPNDVFDTYARFVGDVLVQINGEEVDINHWLVEEGWAFPTFYTSMSAEEINSFIAAAKKGRQKAERLWHYIQEIIKKFDFNLVYRGKGASYEQADDLGPLIMPKLFRRHCTWAVYRRAGIVTKKFLQYLIETRDDFFLTEEFLEQGQSAATLHFLGDFLQANGKFELEPEDMVFREKQSKLVGPDGEIITTW